MPDSPGRLIALIVTGGVLGAASLTLPRMVVPPGSLPGVLIFLVLILAGAVSVYVGGDHLREGIRNERWSEESVARLRAMVEHPAWMWLVGLLLVAMVCVGVAQFRGGRLHGWFWGVFLLSQAQTQISSAFRRPQLQAVSGMGTDWRQATKLHSEHWGER